MKSIIITIASILLIAAFAEAQHPAKVRLKEKVEVPINSGGKSVAISVPPGTVLNVRSVKGEVLTLEYLGSLVEVSSKKTDLSDQLAFRRAEEDRKARLIADTHLAEAKMKKEKEKQEQQNEYRDIKQSVAYIKQNLKNIYVGSDIKFMLQRIIEEENFIEKFEAANDEGKATALSARSQMFNQNVDNKMLYGYKYNDILKKEVEVPMSFGIYTNNDVFYLKVGEGNFCTYANLPIQALGKLAEQLNKITEWRQKCGDEKLETQKEAGEFGGLKIDFVSTDSGQNIYLWLTVSGHFAEDRLLEKQTVRLNMLNYQVLRRRLSTCTELYDQREKSRLNAGKLK